jgi:hypothetical protein
MKRATIWHAAGDMHPEMFVLNFNLILKMEAVSPETSNCLDGRTQKTSLFITQCFSYCSFLRGTRKHGWLRHCATSLKVEGSNSDDRIGFF